MTSKEGDPFPFATASNISVHNPHHVGHLGRQLDLPKVCFLEATTEERNNLRLGSCLKAVGLLRRRKHLSTAPLQSIPQWQTTLLFGGHDLELVERNSSNRESFTAAATVAIHIKAPRHVQHLTSQAPLHQRLASAVSSRGSPQLLLESWRTNAT